MEYKDNAIYKSYFYLFTIFAVFAFHTGDFEHYKDAVEYSYQYPNRYAHMEDLYVWIVECVGGNYYLWRLLVWGTFFFFMYLILKKVRGDNYISLLFFTVLIFPHSVEGRFVLGLAVFMYGAVLFVNESVRNRLIGIMFIIASYFGHRSIVLLIFLFPFLYMKLSRKLIIISILSFPICIVSFDFILDLFIKSDGLISGVVDEEASQYYLNRKNDVMLMSSVGLVIINAIRYTVYSLFLFVILYKVSRLKYKLSTRAQFASFSYVLFYVSGLIYFSKLGNEIMFFRYFVMLPYFFVLLLPLILKETFYKSHLFWWLMAIMFFEQNFFMTLQMYYFSFSR